MVHLPSAFILVVQLLYFSLNKYKELNVLILIFWRHLMRLN